MALVVARVDGLVTVQDEGRPGSMHRGVPAGGPIDPRAFGAATSAVGASTALEITGRVELVARDAAEVAVDGEGRRALAPGEVFVAASERGRRVRYLAVAGGFDVPLALGGRGTLLVAGVGGFAGRPLARGDVLAIGEAPRSAPSPPPPPGPATPMARDEVVVRVVAGPDPEHFAAGALDALARAAYLARAFDRTGARLEGPPIPRSGAGPSRSAPMVRGAIQVPPDGAPIVLGPDHPTTGGYPVVAVVVPDDFGLVEQASPGGRVRFVVVTLGGSSSTSVRASEA